MVIRQALRGIADGEVNAHRARTFPLGIHSQRTSGSEVNGASSLSPFIRFKTPSNSMYRRVTFLRITPVSGRNAGTEMMHSNASISQITFDYNLGYSPGVV